MAMGSGCALSKSGTWPSGKKYMRIQNKDRRRERKGEGGNMLGIIVVHGAQVIRVIVRKGVKLQ